MKDANTGRQKRTRGLKRREAPLTCNFCCRVFMRKEHLTRHLRVHTRERPFICDTCGKEFSRLDILNRHARVHTQKEAEIVAGRTQRNAACLQCATSRVRCTRGDPCGRCEARGLPCERRPRSSRNKGTGSEEHTVAEAHPMVDLQISQTERSPMGPPEPPVDNSDWAHDPQMLGDSIVYDSRGNQLLETGITYDPDTHGLHTTDHFVPRPLSTVNWLSPDDSILQEWASQLAVIQDHGIFPTPFTVPDGSAIPQLLGMEPPVGWAPGNESNTDHSQIDPQAVMMSYAEPAANGSPETLMDGQSSHNSQSTSGKYYANSVAWRVPFQSRNRKGQLACSVDGGNATGPVPSTGSIGYFADIDGTASSLSKWLSEDVYASIVRGVEEANQLSSKLPSLQAFRLCMHLYFEHLHPTFPFLRKAAFISEKPHWILSLAVAGVGAVYLRSVQGTQWKDTIIQALDRLLSRRLQHFRTSFNTNSPTTSIFDTVKQVEDVLPLVQAKILHLLCLLHSGVKYTAQCAMFERADLVQWCSYLSLVPDCAGVFASSASRKDTKQWVKDQSSLRTGMMIWLLDSLVAYELSCSHLMKLGDTKGWLPCPEVAWENPSFENIAFAEGVSISLLDALDLVYIEKRLAPQLSQFSQILLIHAIYRRTTEVADQSRMRLSSWSPTDSVQIFRPGPISSQATWPPSSNIFVKWRNAACDALDVLHCAANSRAAQSCWEEPTILYLHFARIILLSPFMHFQTLAQDPLLCARGRPSINTSHQDRFDHARNMVFQWAIRDQFKARLSVIHAGALLWHVRRFSTGSFIEPFGIYIATLLLWAYSLSTQTVRAAQIGTAQQSERHTHTSSLHQTSSMNSLPGDEDAETDESDAEPRFIYLDRPLDDELVQMYIRVGSKVSAQLKGVGNITSDGAPVKILKQGFHLLTGEKYPGRNGGNGASGGINCQTWDIHRLYAVTIRALIEAN